tara:strand:+ start:126 stop:341 length:216 start_codon:yes stop_codon:yes gene_type:complete
MTCASHEAMKICAECGGTGTILIELYHRQSFNVDSGYIEERVEVCHDCQGSGEREQDDCDENEDEVNNGSS